MRDAGEVLARAGGVAAAHADARQHAAEDVAELGLGRVEAVVGAFVER